MKDFLDKILSRFLGFQIQFPENLKVIWRNGDRLGVVPIIGLQAGKTIMVISHTIFFVDEQMRGCAKTRI